MNNFLPSCLILDANVLVSSLMSDNAKEFLMKLLARGFKLYSTVGIWQEVEKVFFEIAQRRNIREGMILETLKECQQSVDLFMVIFSKSNGFRVSAHARLPEKLSKKKQPSRDWELVALSLYLNESNAILSNDKDFGVAECLCGLYGA